MFATRSVKNIFLFFINLEGTSVQCNMNRGRKNVKNHHTVKDYREHNDSKNVKRSGYLICVVKKDVLHDMGAKVLAPGVCYIVKDYSELDTDQKCAVIGVSRDMLGSFFEHSTNSQLIKLIKSCEDFSEITGMQFLDKSKVESVLHNFISHFSEVTQDDYIVFNIEPAGKGRLKRIYPCARITIPGGSMETIDNYSFEECAIREFKEETCIHIENYRLIKSVKVKNIGRNSSSRFTHFSSAYKPVGIQNLFISMYYFIVHSR